MEPRRRGLIIFPAIRYFAIDRAFCGFCDASLCRFQACSGTRSLPRHFSERRRGAGAIRRSASILAQSFSDRARRDRAARGVLVRRGPGGSIDAGCESDQMASRACDLVLRRVLAAQVCAGLQAVRRALRLSVQFLLRLGGTPARPPAARPDHAAWRRGGDRLSRARRSGRRGADRIGERSCAAHADHRDRT